MDWIAILIILLFSLLQGSYMMNIVFETGEEVCQECICTRIYKVNCSNKMLEFMPTFPSGYTNLNVTSYYVEENGIKEIERDDLKPFPNLKTVRLFGNEIEVLPEDLFRNNTKIKYIRLRNNKLKSIPKHLFKWIPNLYMLSIAENRVEELDKDLFKNNKKLRKVWFYQNFITSIPETLFWTTPNLRLVKFGSENLELEISMRVNQKISNSSIQNETVNTIKAQNYMWREKHNSIGELHEDLFKITTKLSTLSLSRCDIKSIPCGLFKNTIKLKYLYLYGNDLSTLCKSLFNETTKLHTLNLNFNKLKSLPPGLFERNGKLLGLYLEGNKLSNLPTNIFWNNMNLLRLSLANNRLSNLPINMFRYNSKLRHLYLYGNDLSTLCKSLFNETTKLHTLNLNFNKLKSLPPGLFERNGKLLGLYLEGNKLISLPTNIFWNNTNLLRLSLANNRLRNLPINMFRYNSKLRHLNLSKNNLNEINMGTFAGLRDLEILDISEIYTITSIDWRFLNEIQNLTTLMTSVFVHCCYAEVYRPSLRCVTPEVVISSCNNLIRSGYLRVVIWINFILAIGCNAIAVLLRCFKKRGERDRGQNALVINLAVSDLVMGLYLAIIAIKDLTWRDVYYKHDHEWRNSSLCHFSGVLSLLSCQVSVFTLAVITYFRYKAIVHSIHSPRHLTKKTALIVIAVIWLLALGISVPPTFIRSYFYDEVSRKEFYGSNGVCLPLQLPGERTTAWEYSLAIFGVLNLVLCIHMVGSYIKMFLTVFKSSNTTRSAVMKEEFAIALRFFFVVLTDICCWLPVSVLMVLSLVDVIDYSKSEVYAWFAICVIPINSTVNPLIYTLTAPGIWKQIKEFSNSINSHVSSIKVIHENTMETNEERVIETVAVGSKSSQDQLAPQVTNL